MKESHFHLHEYLTRAKRVSVPLQSLNFHPKKKALEHFAHVSPRSHLQRRLPLTKSVFPEEDLHHCLLFAEGL